MLGVGVMAPVAAGAIALVIRARRRRHQHSPPPKSLREKLRIREATPNDAARILQWVHHINAERNPYLIMEPGEFTMTEEKERNFLQECAVSPNRLFLLGFVGGDGNDGEEASPEEIAAVCQIRASVRAKVRHRGTVGMTVTKKFRGRGVGGAMLDRLIAWATANAVLTKLELVVHDDNARAQGLYLSRGFEREGRVRNAVRIDGKYYDQVMMGMDVVA